MIRYAAKIDYSRHKFNPTARGVFDHLLLFMHGELKIFTDGGAGGCLKWVAA